MRTTYTDANGVVWTIYEDPASSQGYWLAEVTSANAPYSPSLSAPNMAAAFAKVQAYAAARGPVASSSSSSSWLPWLLVIGYLVMNRRGTR